VEKEGIGFPRGNLQLKPLGEPLASFKTQSPNPQISKRGKNFLPLAQGGPTPW